MEKLELITKPIAGLNLDANTRDHVAYGFARALKNANHEVRQYDSRVPRFNRIRFLKACGGDDFTIAFEEGYRDAMTRVDAE